MKTTPPTSGAACVADGALGPVWSTGRWGPYDRRGAGGREADVGTWVATRGDAVYWRHADEIDTDVDGETVVATAEIDSVIMYTD